MPEKAKASDMVIKFDFEIDREAEISQIDAYDDDTYISTMNEQLPVQQDWYGNQQQQG